MANLCALRVGAGSGDRTRITSLEGVRGRRFAQFSRQNQPARTRNEAGFIGEHRPILPQPYRTENVGPASDGNREQGLAINAKEPRHG